MDTSSIDAPPAASAAYFDGTSSRRRQVTLRFADALEIEEEGRTVAAWPYADIVAPTVRPSCCG